MVWRDSSLSSSNAAQVQRKLPQSDENVWAMFNHETKNLPSTGLRPQPVPTPVVRACFLPLQSDELDGDHGEPETKPILWLSSPDQTGLSGSEHTRHINAESSRSAHTSSPRTNEPNYVCLHRDRIPKVPHVIALENMELIWRVWCCDSQPLYKVEEPS